jgi:hypothetical protein
MFLKRRLAAFAPVIVALAVGAPVALASAATLPVTGPVITGPSCPDGYAGPTNLATGCPYWMMSYSVKFPGQPPLRCPVSWSPPLAMHGVGAASTRGAAPGSAGRVVYGCPAVATAK